jgi:WD40 repeat protein
VGSATITLSFDAWKGANVAPTTHTVQVLAAKLGPKAEAVAPNLVATLTHPDRKASVATVKFSADGAKLFTAGYPSGIVQVWDVAARKELRRVNAPPGLRGSADYAQLTPDWKTVYVPVEARKIVRGEKDGKPFVRIEESGEIRVWDMTTGEERPPLKPPAGSGPGYSKLSPDGGRLICIEALTHDAEDRTNLGVTAVWDLKTGVRRKMADGHAIPHFSPDGATLVTHTFDYQGKTSVLRLHDAGTYRELGRLDCPDKDRHFTLAAFSPDGAALAVSLGGKKAAPLEVWFLDARTLADLGKYAGKGHPERYGWGEGAFTPDGTRYAAAGERVEVWDVAAKKVVRSVEASPNVNTLAVSPDGKTVAVAWMPKIDVEEARSRDPDPADYPQPRVSLIDLTADAPPRVLVCPHGFVRALAFAPDGKMLAAGTSGGVHLFDLGK